MDNDKISLCLQLIWSGFRVSQTVPHDLKWSKMAPNLSQMVPIDPQWSQIVSYVLKWSENGQNFPNG